MGYPVYKLLRAINRQYPNNGFINYVDVNEETTDGIIDEDLRDLINEALQETYINIALDEVYSFPTVPGQKEYALPEDCDLRDIQEVTRTFRGPRCPMPPPPPNPLPTIFTVTFYANGGTGTMTPIEAEFGEEITLPACTFTAPVGNEFFEYEIDGEAYQPGETYVVNKDTTVTAIWEAAIYTITFRADPDYFTFVTAGSSGGDLTFQATGGLKLSASVSQVPTVRCNSADNTLTGWEYNSNLMQDEQILDTIVPGDMLFEAQYSNVGSWNLIISNLSETALEIRSKLLADTETTTTIVTSETASYPIAKGDALGERYEYIKVYASWMDEAHEVHYTLVYEADMTEVLGQDETIPIIKHGITFEVDPTKGNLGEVDGNPIYTFTKYVTEGCNIESNVFEVELESVYPEDGYVFRGWSLDGVNVIPNETILGTKVVADIYYTGVFEAEGE